MFCPSCGYKMNNGERYCDACGALMVHGPKVHGEAAQNTPSLDPLMEQASNKKFNRQNIRGNVISFTADVNITESAAVKKAAEEVVKKKAEEKAAKEAAEAAAKEAAVKEAAAKKAAAKEKAAEEAAEKALSDIEKAIKESAKRIAAKKAAIERAEAKKATEKAEAAKEAARKASIEAAKKEAAAKKAAEEAAAKKAAQEAARKATEEAEKRKAEQEAAAKKAAQEAAAKAAEEEKKKKAAQEAAAKAAEEEKKKKATQEAAAKAAEEEKKKKAEQEAAANTTANEAAENPVSSPYPGFNITEGSFPTVSIALDKEQFIYSQSDVMVWMSGDIIIETNTKHGGSLFTAAYTAQTDGQTIGIASPYPSEIKALNISNGAVIIQKRAFLAAQPSVTLSAHISIQLGEGQNSGSFVFQRLSGTGITLIAAGGSLIERTLSPAETIKTDTANIAAFEGSISFQTEIVAGFKNSRGGEGLLVSSLTGPGKVWLQTVKTPAR